MCASNRAPNAPYPLQREKDQPNGSAEDGGGGGGGSSLVSFEGVYTLLDLQRPSAEAVRAVRDFTGEGGWGERRGSEPRSRGGDVGR